MYLCPNVKYYVITRFFDNGKVEVEILTESEYKGQPACTETTHCDEYCDCFGSYEEAKKFADQAKKC